MLDSSHCAQCKSNINQFRLDRQVSVSQFSDGGIYLLSVGVYLRRPQKRAGTILSFLGDEPLG